jgi:hypothetical protein
MILTSEGSCRRKNILTTAIVRLNEAVAFVCKELFQRTLQSASATSSASISTAIPTSAPTTFWTPRRRPWLPSLVVRSCIIADSHALVDLRIGACECSRRSEQITTAIVRRDEAKTFIGKVLFDGPAGHGFS